ncbi:MAG: alpha/beta hydrolase [Proteobacteria bacterium]|nr:alpha/beta hydrolase [Pseudomonadota bacterium]
MIRDFDDAYSNSAYIPCGADYPARWTADAALFRAAQTNAMLDLRYGDGPRQACDVFMPAGTPKGLAVFVHGGYWMRFGKADWSHLAAGAQARGWVVVLPGYTLAPDNSIGGITSEIAKAITMLAKRFDGPLRIAGHSAGGHLASRMICEPSQLPLEVLERVAKVVSISGLHDLRPFLRTKMNETLKLTELEARNESPALRRPRDGVSVTAWVGSDERPEFIRQSELLANVWTGLGVDIHVHHEPRRHHFDVIDDLRSADSYLTRLFAP